ncbi:MAG: citrate synthase/methylcitrate synthase [Anaerolineae bacterium]|nr:citrate synthase/methylcitrate synthase [Anaerolineae bacterium]
MLNNIDYKPGLEGVVAAQTRLSSVDGAAGELIIAGFPLEAIADKATFEEMVYLLWNDTLPDAAELAEFRAALAKRRVLSAATLEVLRAAAADKVDGMDALRMAASTLNLGESSADPHDDALRLVAAFPTIVAAYWRLSNGNEPIAPRTDLGHAANTLYMLTGDEPREARVRGLETYLNTVVDHGLNASTFTARVIISTGSDMISAIVGALGALKGPLHGGAPGPALDMVFEIGEAANAESYLREKLSRGERLMGFGHRVYKVRDPRADVLAAAAAKLYQADGDMALYKLVLDVEQTALRLLEEYKPGRKLQTNVEFYTALLLHGLGLPTDLFTPMFAISRVGGWTAHAFEQQTANRIIRPQSVYLGEKTRRYQAIDGR